MRRKQLKKRLLSFGMALLFLCSTNPVYTLSVYAEEDPSASEPENVVQVSVTGVNKIPGSEWTNQEVTIDGQVIHGSEGTGDFSYSARFSTDENAYNNDDPDDTIETMTANNVTPLSLDEDKNFSFVTSQGEGSLTYYIWAYDGDKEKSELNQITVNIDQTNPVIDTILSSANELPTNEAVNISGIVSDTGGSGVAKVRYSTDLADFENDTYENTERLQADLSGDDFSFEVDVEDNKRHEATYYVWVYDQAGNKSSGVKEINVHIDKIRPVINSVEKNPDVEWTNQPVKVTVDALQENPEEEDHNVIGIRYGSVNDFDSATPLTDGDNGKYTFTIPAQDFVGNYFIWAVNGRKNKTETPWSIPIKIDSTIPVITKYEIKTKNDNAFSKAINFLTRGAFFNKAVEVTVTAKDPGNGSGLKDISLYEDGSKIETKEVSGKTGKVKFTIEQIPYKKSLSAIATDVAGNSSGQTKPTDTDSDLPGDQIILEDIQPEINVTPSKAFYVDGAKAGWYNSEALFNINVSDETADDSGLKSVEIFLNGKNLTKDSTGKRIESDYQSDKKSDLYIISTKQAEVSEDSTYTLYVKVIDNCGNEKEYTTTIHQDIKKPTVTKVEFSPLGNQESKGQIVQTAKYGYFFKNNTQVTITAKDNENGSGVKNITYYTVDYSKNKAGIQSEIKTVRVNKKSQITFIIKANFKGKIYAKATDYVALSSAYGTPDASIVESAAKHKQTSDINMKIPSSTKKDKNGMDLYNKNVPVELTIGDYYSGLAKVEWSVISPYDTQNNQSGIVTIENDKTLQGNSEGVKISKTDNNLVTEVKKTLTVANNSNNIKVKAKLTDRAGHTSEKELVFSIDKTVPAVQVSYDNNDYDPDFADETQYYKSDRTATIVVTERNFNPDDIKVTITNTDGSIPALSNWVETKNAEEEDKTTYTATIAYTQDGDYEFTMGYEDLAGNATANIETQKFTIDKTLPTIQISYDNNNADNTNYYKESRTATITINEHNFETSRIKPAISAKEGTSIPGISGWSTNGDVHTATITFQEDSLYSFDLEYTDKAGNIAEKLQEETFYVDQTAPTLTVRGIKNNSANSGKDENNNEVKVGFVIESTDENFANAIPHLVMVTLEGTKNCDDLLGSPQNMQNGQRYTVENLKEDGIYILSATAIDKAGNETKTAQVTGSDGVIIEAEQISFSINRKGSLYTLDEQTQKINGSYSREETDIIIKETNVNALNKMKLTLFSDSKTQVLEEGKDYRLDKTMGDGQWNQYTYTVYKENFQEDGFYNLNLYSVDEAANESGNTMDTKNVEVRFAIDKTPPNVILTDLKDKEAYEAASKEFTMVVNDNIKLEEVKVYHTTYDGRKDNADYGEPSQIWTSDDIQKMQEENQDFIYNIDGDTTEKHKVKIVARDAAGSETEVEAVDFYVTENWWINFKTDSVKVLAAFGGTVVLIGGSGGIIGLNRKRRRKIA